MSLAERCDECGRLLGARRFTRVACQCPWPEASPDLDAWLRGPRHTDAGRVAPIPHNHLPHLMEGKPL